MVGTFVKKSSVVITATRVEVRVIEPVSRATVGGYLNGGRVINQDKADSIEFL